MSQALVQFEKREVLEAFPDACAVYVPFAPSLGLKDCGWLIRAKVGGLKRAPLTPVRFETADQAWAGAYRNLPFYRVREFTARDREAV